MVSIGGQSAPPSLKAIPVMIGGQTKIHYRGAVRPPFIEGTSSDRNATLRCPIGGQSAPPSLKGHHRCKPIQHSQAIGGQSAPPSLKGLLAQEDERIGLVYRGAVRPPFIEGGWCGAHA